MGVYLCEMYFEYGSVVQKKIISIYSIFSTGGQ